MAASASIVPLAIGRSAPDVWVPVREQSLVVANGSPLDFSTLLPNPAITSDNHLTIGPKGHLAYSAAPGVPARLLCASLAWSPASGGFPDHQSADLYARQLAMHGYNIARFHYLDASLMDGRAADFDFDPETLDRFRYLMAALKQNGISWIMDGVTSTRAAYGGFDDRWDYNGSFKTDLYSDQAAVAHWTELQHRLLGTVNPYTDIAPIDDPALSMVVLANENGLEFDSWVYAKPGQQISPPKLRPAFNQWLLSRYGSTTELGKAWGGVPNGQSLEDGMVALPDSRHDQGQRGRDVAAFFVSIERATAEKLSGALRQLGYRGIISDYNNWATVQTALSRQDLQAVTMNTYQGFVASYSPGARIEQKSSLTDAASYVREAAAARWLDRPFVVTEYDQLFWNKYRYEAGLVMPSYAALQGWDGICRHAQGPIVLRYGEDYPQKKQLLPYAIALDPIARAGETLSALLYRRGDVATAPSTIPFKLSGVDDLPSDLEAREPNALTDLALLDGIGLATDTGAADPAIPEPRDDGSFANVVDRLKAKGEVPDANRTDAGRGVFESATGQLLLDANAGQMTADTPLTAAAAFQVITKPIALGALTITRSSGPALFAVSALDGQPLAQSRRLLVIFATDARNSGMRFADGGDEVIADFGHLPAVIRRGQVTFSLDGSGPWKLSPVGLDGVVHAAVARGTGTVSMALGNAPPSGPTTYFLIER